MSKWVPAINKALHSKAAGENQCEWPLSGLTVSRFPIEGVQIQIRLVR